jgi:hypothetical protein
MIFLNILYRAYYERFINKTQFLYYRSDKQLEINTYFYLTKN